MRPATAPIPIGLPPLSIEITVDSEQYAYRPYLTREDAAVYAGTPLPFGYGITAVFRSKFLAEGRE